VTLIMGKCTFCGSSIEIEGRVGRRDECTKCHRDLHACLQCSLYDRTYHNQCRETQSQCISDKESSNFCEHFQFGRDSKNEDKEVEDSKKKLDELFK